MSERDLYFFKFVPQLLEKVWGGDQLKKIYHKENGERIGESWEVSGVKGHVSVISNGALRGKDLNFLTNHFGAALVGKKVFDRFGTEFPLLFKFIDAREDLSVQLHPDDTIAKKKHDSFGKTEMWFVLHNEPESRLILGFKENTNLQSYLDHLKEGRITEILEEVPVKEGDAFLIEPGTVHAIGSGIVLAEIQQTSDITYRIYDWDRPDNNGDMRTLHTKEALDSIHFSSSKEALLPYKEKWNTPVKICESDYFYTSLLKLNQNIVLNYDSIDSFVVYMCIKGECEVKSDQYSEFLSEGESMLIPASIGKIDIKTENVSILEVFVP